MSASRPAVSERIAPCGQAQRCTECRSDAGAPDSPQQSPDEELPADSLIRASRQPRARRCERRQPSARRILQPPAGEESVCMCLPVNAFV